MIGSELNTRRIEPWAVIVIVGSCVTALAAGYAISFGTGSHTSTINCLPAGSAQHPVGSGL